MQTRKQIFNAINTGSCGIMAVFLTWLFAMGVAMAQEVHPDSLAADSMAVRARSLSAIDAPMTLPSVPNISYTVPAQLLTGTSVSYSPTNTGGAVYADGDVTTFAGSVQGYADGTVTAAKFYNPAGVVFDASGNLYVSDAKNHRIRKITPEGAVTTLAGSGLAGSSNGTGTAASFNVPTGLALDGSGNLYVVDRGNHRIRKVTPSGAVTTFAGSVQGSANGTGTAAQFNTPTDIAVDGSGNVYVSEDAGHRIRKITSGGIVTTLAGSGTAGSTDGTGTAASFNYPGGLAIDGSGNLYVADQANFLIRKVTPAGVVTAFATGVVRPISLERDASGNLYAGELNSHRIKKITAAGTVTTIAGTGSVGSDNGAPLSASFNFIGGIAGDPQGNLYIADQNNNRIRRMGMGQGYSVSPALPAGLTLNRTTGVISGTPTVTAIAATYTVTAYNAGGTDTYAITFSVGSATFSSDQNYVVKRVYLQPFTTAPASPTVDQSMQDIGYYDGLGRPLQDVAVKAAPSKTKDVVTPMAYDAYGRQEYQYLPYATTTGAGGKYKSGAVSAQGGYYSGTATVPQGQTAHAYAYSRTVFESSPMNRVLEQGFPGQAWQPSSSRTATTGHTVATEYTVNNATAFATVATTRMVSRYGVTLGTTGVPTLTLNGTYAAGELYVTVTKDENWNGQSSTFAGRLYTTEEYRDKLDRVVLHRTFNGTGELLSTYYVYNDLGQLSFVLTPELGPDRTGTTAPAATELNNFAYQYRYDKWGRMAYRRLPGGGTWETYNYNKMGWLVFHQDSRQVQETYAGFTPGQYHTFYKYDGQGRVIMKGVERNRTMTREAIEGTLSTWPTQWEDRSKATGNFHGYTNQGIPSDAQYLDVLEVNYYDRYDTIPGLPVAPLAVHSKLTHGKLVANKTKVLGTSNYLWTVYFYDDRGNVVREWKQHYLGGSKGAGKFDDIQREYTFTGQLKKETRKHHTTSTTSPEVTVVTEYESDHRERPLRTWKTVVPKGATEGRRILLSENTYNEVGQLYAKGLHSDTEGEEAPAQVILDGGDVVSAGQERTVRAGTSITLSPGFHAQQGSYFHAAIGGSFGQEIRYAYNERGWLSATSSDLFRQTLRYADTTLNRQYNGNISHQVFSRRASAGTSPAWLTDTYSYTYDAANRLTVGSLKDGKGRETLAYDRNGNIRTLRRTGSTATLVDSLSYSYTGNRLTAIADAFTASTDGNYQLPGTTSYLYDANGNMTRRRNTGSGRDGNNIDTVIYNYLNLPQSVTAVTGNVTYVYNGTGRKLRSTGGLVGQTRDYIDGIEYYNGTMELIHTEEGRIVRSGSVYEYDYFIRDHLGNNRTGFKEGSDVKVPNFTADYYAFGLPYTHSSFSKPGSPKNNYLYNGKELQDGIKQYDYGARFYDPVIGRWGSVDPMAENYYSSTPYNYVDNNPVLRIDPNGMDWKSTHTDKWGNVLAIYDDGDLGVYKHDDATSKNEVDEKRKSSGTTSGGGKHMGETWTPFGFADFEYFQDNGIASDGSVKVGRGAKIDFDSDWAFYEVRDILSKNPSAYEYSTKAGGYGDWDIKRNSPRGYYYGSKLYGRYASARDAGNFAAGAVAERSIMPNLILDYGFGLYNQSNNRKGVAAIMGLLDYYTGSTQPLMGFGLLNYRANYGEDILSRHGIDAGKRYIKR